MSPASKKVNATSTQRDTNEISGEVGGNAVIVQGTEAHVDITQRQATPSEMRRQAQTADLVLLKHTVLSKLEIIKKQISPSIEKGRNPYRFGQALGYKDSELLAGRDTVISNILEHLKTDYAVFLAGNGGSGKTSLLQAGLIPQISRQGDLPVLVSTTTESLETRIKRQFLGEVTQTQYLSQIPLSTFLQHVTECLPQAKHVYILIDEVEDFLRRSSTETDIFKQEWIQCVNNIPRIHWLFSIHLGLSHLLNFFRPEVNPFSNLVILPPLDRDSARQAIMKPASIEGIKIDDQVMENILDQLGNADIDPAQLQTICYLMAGGSGPLNSNWTQQDYENKGRAEGILRQSLESLIGQLKRGERETAWRVLASLIEHQNGSVPFEWLADHLKPYKVGSESLERMLNLLEEIHLIDVEDEQYHLTSNSMRPRIQQWANEQTVLVQARQEAMYQLRQLRDSALRGLFGGAFGFILFDQLVFSGKALDISYAITFTIPVAAIGGISGFLLTLTMDLSTAAYHGARTRIRYVVGGLGGIVAFGAGFLLYISNNYMGNPLLQVLPRAALEGSLWGAAIGIGTTYGLSKTRKSWLIVLIVSMICGLIFLGLVSSLGVLVNETWKEAPSTLQIFLAGAVVPLCYITSALFRRPTMESTGES